MSSPHFPISKILVAVVAASLLTVAFGCGKNNGPERYAVSGNATYAGKSIPIGMIQFNPDSAKGNSGPQGFAMIKNGRFDTRLPGGRGTIGGPQQIRIVGFDGQKRGEESPNGNRLFPTFIFEKDMPTTSTSFDIDVPESR